MEMVHVGLSGEAAGGVQGGWPRFKSCLSCMPDHGGGSLSLSYFSVQWGQNDTFLTVLLGDSIRSLWRVPGTVRSATLRYNHWHHSAFPTSLLPRLSLIVKQDFSLESERVLCGTAAQAMCGKWQVASMQPLAHRGHPYRLRVQWDVGVRAGAVCPGSDGLWRP